jgi:isopentenyl diphosphate isomerase/L-lactate dehydrogenase-like FMN-dependent dehydrogenase
VYLGGLQGQRPEIPVSPDELERRAQERLSPEAFGYVAGGAGGEETVRSNREAFGRWRIVPRMLRDVGERELSVDLFGERLPVPVLLAPVGVLSIVHPEAEVAVARAAAKLGLPMVLSTAASKSLEEVAGALGASPHWYQLYWGKDPELVASMLERADRAGYGALVVTLDTNILGWRERDVQYAYLPFLLGEGLGNYLSDPVFRAGLAQPPEQDPQGAILHWVQVFSNPTLTWDDLRFARERWKKPILLKGILHADDAAKALDAGMDGVIVSNHGGRQVDGAVAALEALPTVVERVGGRVPVLFDSGIRRGADAFKALALGARAVLLGRPYVYGLALGGAQGVEEVALNFLADFDLTLALSGYRSVRELSAATLLRER